MAKKTKTPVMLLQELAVKRNTVPEYELIFSQQGTHENKFHYQVTLLREQAAGMGRSKKEAKHEAASKALEQLAKRGIYHPDMMNNHAVGLDVRQDQMRAPLNYIPKLLDICIENRIPLAEFVEISDVGPPHCREFTYECRVSHITTRAIAGSKKHAKQLAAKDMLDRIYNIIPELQQETDQLMLRDDEEEVLHKYKNFSTNFNPVKTNFNSKAAEYDLQFRKLMIDLDISTDTVMRVLEQSPSKNVLEEFVDLFDVKFEIKPLQQSAPIFMVNIHSDTPLTVLETGNNLEEAEAMVIKKTVEILKVLGGTGTANIVSSICYSCVAFSQLIIYHWLGSEIIFKSGKITEACYLSQWYDLHVKSQKTLMLLMERSKRPLVLELYKFVSISLETLGVIIRWSYSLLALIKARYN